MAESLKDFLARDPSYDEVHDMHSRNAVTRWDSPHPHQMVVTGGKGPYLSGMVKTDDGLVVHLEEVSDTNTQILCNAAGYGNEEVEEARALAREKTRMDVTSSNFLFPVVEWAREQVLNSLPPEWRNENPRVLYVTSGTEGNDAARRALRAYSNTGGNPALINLRRGYSGAGVAANAACGHPAWQGDSTYDLGFNHFTDADPSNLRTVLSDLSPTQAAVLMSEAGNFGVGGFYGIPDAFLRDAVHLLRSRMHPAHPERRMGSVVMDEVQTGLGRTGTTFWASERIFNAMHMPEAMVSAKGLGSNHRAAIVILRGDVAHSVDGLTYHTFAQNLEDCATLGTVLQMAIRDNWTENAHLRGVQLRNEFCDSGVVHRESRIPFSTHGAGLMFGIELDTPRRVNAVLKRAPFDGWVSGKGGIDGRVLRVAPPLNVTDQFIADLAQKIARTFAHPDVEKAV